MLGYVKIPSYCYVRHQPPLDRGISGAGTATMPADSHRSLQGRQPTSPGEGSSGPPPPPPPSPLHRPGPRRRRQMEARGQAPQEGGAPPTHRSPEGAHQHPQADPHQQDRRCSLPAQVLGTRLPLTGLPLRVMAVGDSQTYMILRLPTLLQGAGSCYASLPPQTGLEAANLGRPTSRR